MKITIEEIINCFSNTDDVLKVEQIKSIIYERRNYSSLSYKDKYSFDQTIQAKINKYCPQYKNHSEDDETYFFKTE